MLLQFAEGKLQNILIGNGLGDGELARGEPPEGDEMGAAAGFLAEFMSDRSNISAFCAGDPKVRERLLVTAELEFVDMNQPRFALYLQAFAGQFVKRDTL